MTFVVVLTFDEKRLRIELWVKCGDQLEASQWAEKKAELEGATIFWGKQISDRSQGTILAGTTPTKNGELV